MDRPRSGMIFPLVVFLVLSLSSIGVDSSIRGDKASRDIVRGELGKSLDDYLTRITPLWLQSEALFYFRRKAIPLR